MIRLLGSQQTQKTERRKPRTLERVMSNPKLYWFIRRTQHVEWDTRRDPGEHDVDFSFII